MKRVLVTGGAGFIGSHLVDRLLGEGHEVVIVDNLSAGSREHLAAATKARLLVANVLDIGTLEAELRGVEVIFHLAGLISGQDSLREPDNYFEANVTGTQRVIETGARIGARRIVFASSSTVYGNAPEPDRRETLVPAPLTPYALSKLTAEHLLGMYAPLEKLSQVSLRLFNVYGPRQNPNHPYANVTCKVAHAATNSRAIDLYGDGHQTRDFVYVGDVVNAFMAVGFESKQSLYNVGSGASHSINDVIAMVERVSGVELTRRQRPPWSNDIRSIRADIQRLATDHGYSPAVSLEQGLARTVAYFRDA
jgi:UDP-glucose 4-epimerase